MAMMSWMRRTSRYFLVVVVLTFIASLAYFGATQDRAGPDWVVSVNGDEVSALAYQRAYRATVEQYRQLFKDRFTDEMARSLKLQEQVIDSLVTDRLIHQGAPAEGISVSNEELAAEIARMGVFHAGGGFSREQYLKVLSRAGLTPAQFEPDMRGELLRRKLQTLLTAGVKVTEAELRQQWEIRQERVRAAYLLVSPESFLASAEATEAEVEAYHKAHPAEFTRPERRRILAAILPAASVPAPTVTDADVEAAYKERRREFEQPTRVRLAHILVRVPSVGGSEAEDKAREKAEAALRRVREGADFAQVAREVSEDPATALRGGELGLVAPGEQVPQFEQVAFGLKRGEVAGPVRTPYGYHVMKALEIVPGSKKELREVAATLRANLTAEGQLRALREKAQAAHRALLGASDFAAEARRQGLTLRELGPFGRSDAVEGIGRVSEATAAIFVLPPDGVSAPVKIPDGYAIFRLLERQEARLLPLAEVRGEVLRAVRRQKAQEAAQAKARELLEALRKGEEPAAVAKRAGAAVGETPAFSRVEPLTDRELQQAIGTLALELPRGGVGGPATGPKGVYVVKVLARERPDPAELEKGRSNLERELLEQKRAQAWQGWLAALRARATVEVNRKILPES